MKCPKSLINSLILKLTNFKINLILLMGDNMLKDKIRNKEKIIGAYVQLSDISISRIIGLSGYDFVWVDFEHSYMSFETLLSHVISLKSTGVPVIVRAPQNDLTATKKIIEMGVDGIIFPMVRTKEDAEKVASYVLYPPLGERGFGPMGAIDYGISDVTDYIDNTHKDMCLFIQIEHKDAVDNIEEIMQNDFIDGYIFGPNDLSATYGLLGRPFEPQITKIMKDAIQKLKKAGKYVGIASGGFSEEVLKHWSSFDVEMLSAGADFDFIRDGAKQNRINLEKIHKAK